MELMCACAREHIFQVRVLTRPLSNQLVHHTHHTDAGDFLALVKERIGKERLGQRPQKQLQQARHRVRVCVRVKMHFLLSAKKKKQTNK